MKVTAIYKASNGDVFFEHDGHCEELTKGQQDALMQEAVEFAKTAEPIEVEAKHFTDKIEHISYYKDGEIVGTAGIHVRDKYDPIQNHIYLHRESGTTRNEELAEFIWKKSKETWGRK